MEISTVSNLESRKDSDILILPFFSNKQGVKEAAKFSTALAPYHSPIAVGDFKGKVGEHQIVYGNGKRDKRYLLLGLGDSKELTGEQLRRAYGAAVKACHCTKSATVTIILPSHTDLSDLEIARFITEGLELANYQFTKLKHDALKKDPVQLIKKAVFVGLGAKGLAEAKKTAVLCHSVHQTRDLVNGNADDVTPQALISCAKELAKGNKAISLKVFGTKELKKEGMNLILAVGRAASHDPALILVEYRGGKPKEAPMVLVGKGVTFDTGGLNLKPTGGIETMKCDMAGAAVALSTLQAAAALKLPLNLVAVVPTVENAISSNSYKPGDVYQSYAGKTVEIGNTDAEGRLILADALAYANEHYKPQGIIDIATLTGAVDVALGAEVIGLMSNDDALSERLFNAGLDTFERVWRLPLYEEYRSQLKSDIADIKSIGGRSGASIVAAIFLQEFVGKTPWAHLDIASAAFYNESRRYHPKHATGIGVRLLISFLEAGMEKKSGRKKK